MNNKVALVTGSTSGIGKEIAKKLLQENCVVIINSNKDIGDDFIAQEFGDKDVFFYKADISKKQDLIELKKYIAGKFGELDYLVANAGVCPIPCGIDDITDMNIDKTIDTNLKGTFNTIKIFGDFIRETSKTGSVVAITSVDGIIGEPYGAIYSATKAGIISLVKSFARHYGQPIRINGVAPGLIDTPLTSSTGELAEETTDLSIIKRIGKPEEIASVVSFLLSDEASFVTGQILAVDGGFTLK
jgi:NAD(P)-dependent dehydrogenase (short-subunit alcohol dehydrogenase family)